MVKEERDTHLDRSAEPTLVINGVTGIAAGSPSHLRLYIKTKFIKGLECTQW